MRAFDLGGVPRALLFISVGIYSVIFSFGRFTYGLLVPFMQREFGATYSAMGDVATANLMGYVLGGLFAAPVVRRFGPVRVLTLSLVGLSLALTGLGLAGSVAMAAALFFVVGFLGGQAFVGMMVLLNRQAGSARTRVIGLAASGIGLGMLLSSGVVAAIVPLNPDGWRHAWFGVGVITALIASALVRVDFRTDIPDPRDRKISDWPDAPVDISPQSRRRYAVFAVHILYGFGYFIFVTFISSFLQDFRGASTELASSVFLMIGASSIPAAYFGGVAARRWGHRVTFFCVSISSALAVLLVLMSDERLAYLLSAALIGASLSALPVLTITFVGSTWPPSEIPRMYALVTSGFGVAQALGPPVATRVQMGQHELQGALLLALLALALCSISAIAMPGPSKRSSLSDLHGHSEPPLKRGDSNGDASIQHRARLARGE